MYISLWYVYIIIIWTWRHVYMIYTYIIWISYECDLYTWRHVRMIMIYTNRISIYTWYDMYISCYACIWYVCYAYIWHIYTSYQWYIHIISSVYAMLCIYHNHMIVWVFLHLIWLYTRYDTYHINHMIYDIYITWLYTWYDTWYIS